MLARDRYKRVFTRSIILFRMTEPPVFFLPYLPPDLQGDSYAYMASQVERNVPCLGKRIYSITFSHDETLWTATVGQRLRGYRPVLEKPEKIDRSLPVQDSAMVLAIFPDDPYCVVTDSDPQTLFANPFYAATPTHIEYFFRPKRFHQDWPSAHAKRAWMRAEV
jgi:hypothetical protein